MTDRRKRRSSARGLSRTGLRPKRRLLAYAILLVFALTAAGTTGLFVRRNRRPPRVVIPTDLDRLEPQLRAYLAGFIDDARQSRGDPEKRARLGRVYAANSLWSEAARSFDNALAVGHEGPLPAYHKAVSISRQGKINEAVVSFREVTLEFPDFAPAFHRLGDALLMTGDLDEAESAFRRVIAIATNEAAGYVGLGDIELRRGHFGESANLLEKAVKIKPTHTSARHLLGQAYRGLGRQTEAERELRAGLGSARTNMKDSWSDEMASHKKLLADQVDLAINRLNAGDAETALRILETVLSWHPENVEVMNNLANAYMATNQPEKALDLLRRAIPIDENTFATRINLSVCYTELGRLEEALIEANQSVRLAPKTPEAHTQRGNCLIRLRKPAQAVEAFQTAIRFDPRNPILHLQQALIYRALKRYDEALRHFRSAAGLAPAMLSAHLGCCDVCILLNRPVEADRAFEDARRLNPNDPRVLSLAKRLGK